MRSTILKHCAGRGYNSPLMQDANQKLKEAKSTVDNRKSWDEEKNASQKAYIDKHGSSSGGSDKEWNDQQQLLKSIEAKYNK